MDPADRPDDAARFEPPADARPDDTAWPAMTWPVDPATVLTGETVRLRPLVPERDAPGLFAALDDDRVWRHLAGRPGSPAELARTLAGREISPTRQQWLVTAAGPTGEVLGATSYLDVSAPDARLEIGTTAYRPAAWGTAVNPETKLLLLTLAFETLHAGRVQLKTDVRNVRSQQAIARLGARYEGVLRRYQRRTDGTVRDTVLFSITAEDWPGVHDRLRERLARP